MGRGRPREFDVEEALGRALDVFWRRGYEGASLDDLTAAMGIGRPSLYAAFGSKEALFRRAVARYAEGPGAFVRAAVAEPTARAVAGRVLGGAVEMLADPKNPRGCLAVQGALACGEAAEGVRQELARCRAAGEAVLRERFERADDLPQGADAAALARFLMSVIHGMAVQAAGGAGREALAGVAALAMRVWPIG